MADNDRQFKRQFFGYRRSDVDDHLSGVDASITELRTALDEMASPDHHDLVLRATRKSVEDILAQAHADADAIRTQAEAEAAQLLADAYDIAAARPGDEPSVIDLRPTDPLAAPGPAVTTDFGDEIASALGE